MVEPHFGASYTGAQARYGTAAFQKVLNRKNDLYVSTQDCVRWLSSWASSSWRGWGLARANSSLDTLNVIVIVFISCWLGLIGSFSTLFTLVVIFSLVIRLRLCPNSFCKISQSISEQVLKWMQMRTNVLWQSLSSSLTLVCPIQARRLTTGQQFTQKAQNRADDRWVRTH